MIVDDHPVVVFAMTHLLNAQPGWEVFGDASSPREAMGLMDRHRATVTLLDLVFPDEFGLEYVKWVRVQHPRSKSIVYSIQPADIYAQRCIQSGASGDVGKEASGETIVATVDDLSLEMVPGLLFVPDMLSLNATTIGSHAAVNHDGLNFGSIDANAAPNTVLLGFAGIRIVLNEQFSSTTATTLTLSVNAIHITIDSPLQLVAADVVIGDSNATITIPSPSGVLCLGAPFALAAAGRRRR